MMTTNTQNKMSSARVETLIEAYGSDTRSWPEQEREAALALLAKSPALQALYREAQQLDVALLAEVDELELDEALLSRIVRGLPEQPVPAARRISLHGWSAALAAGVAAVAILFAVINTPPARQPMEQLALQDIDFLLWQEVTGQSSAESNDDAPVDFMSML